MRHLAILFLFLLLSCANDIGEYHEEIETWRAERIKNLTAPVSWSSLSGLYWLKEGENILGSSVDANIKFPPKAALAIGNINYSKDSILFTSSRNVKVREGDNLISKTLMIPDTEDNTSTLSIDSYYFMAIEREEKIGIRIWDTLHEARTLYKSLDYYPIDEKMRVKATYKTYAEPKKVQLKNVLGMDIDMESGGQLEFKIDGQDYKINPLDGGPNDFFLIFADETTGGETYGGGRYLYCTKPNKDGYTFIDFNKAYTPPCGFTSFATCLLPSKANTLAITIMAGEKYNVAH